MPRQQFIISHNKPWAAWAQLDSFYSTRGSHVVLIRWQLDVPGGFLTHMCDTSAGMSRTAGGLSMCLLGGVRVVRHLTWHLAYPEFTIQGSRAGAAGLCDLALEIITASLLLRSVGNTEPAWDHWGRGLHSMWILVGVVLWGASFGDQLPQCLFPAMYII